MGTTEENIVYQLLSTIRASELNNDEVVTERRVRSFLRTHRSFIAYKYSQEGITVSDEFFQPVELTLTKVSKDEWESPIPDIVQLPSNMGMKLLTPAFKNISILSEESYHLNKLNPINKHIATSKVENSKLTIRIPEVSPYAENGGIGQQALLVCLEKNKNKIKMSAILDNPDDGLDYDWTTSDYPIPNEIGQIIKESILKKEFSIILETKSDQVPNAKNDTLRYHDQGNVQR